METIKRENQIGGFDISKVITSFLRSFHVA